MYKPTRYGQTVAGKGKQKIQQKVREMTKERDIVWEGKRFWVLRVSGRKPVTQIMKIGNVASESVETYSPGADGESIAVVRAKWLEDRAEAKYEAEKDEFRLEQPEMFAYRVVAYLSRFGGEGCWPVGLVEMAKVAQQRTQRR
jgi:hypothetical protein